MSLLNLNPNEINSIIPKKLSLRNVRTTGETYGDYYLDNKFQFTVKMPNVHGKKNDISPGLLKACRISVHLTTPEYANLVKCPMTPEEYEEIIRGKIATRSILPRGAKV